MKIANLIRNISEYYPLEYLLTLPPMSKIKMISEDEKITLLIGQKGLYKPVGVSIPNPVTIKEIMKNSYFKDKKFKFEIEFEKEEKDVIGEISTLQKIMERNPKPELNQKLKELINTPEGKNFNALYLFKKEIQEAGDKAEIYLAHGYGEFEEAKITDKVWPNGVPVTKYFDRNESEKIKIPIGNFYILETDSRWYFKMHKNWIAIDRRDNGLLVSPPFDY